VILLGGIGQAVTALVAGWMSVVTRPMLDGIDLLPKRPTAETAEIAGITGSRAQRRPQPTPEQTAAPFDWRSTRADLERLLCRLDEQEQLAARTSGSAYGWMVTAWMVTGWWMV
jgi:hypothetical protein